MSHTPHPHQRVLHIASSSFPRGLDDQWRLSAAPHPQALIRSDDLPDPPAPPAPPALSPPSHRSHLRTGLVHGPRGPIPFQAQDTNGKQANFLQKLYTFLSLDPHPCPEVIYWASDSRQLVIAQPDRLVREVLPTLYKHDKLASFGRQLNIYGFSRLFPGRQFKDANGNVSEASVWAHPTLHRLSTTAELTSIKRRAAPKLFRTRRLANGEIVRSKAGPSVVAKAMEVREVMAESKRRRGVWYSMSGSGSGIGSPGVSARFDDISRQEGTLSVVDSRLAARETANRFSTLVPAISPPRGGQLGTLPPTPITAAVSQTQGTLSNPTPAPVPSPTPVPYHPQPFFTAGYNHSPQYEYHQHDSSLRAHVGATSVAGPACAVLSDIDRRRPSMAERSDTILSAIDEVPESCLPTSWDVQMLNSATYSPSFQPPSPITSTVPDHPSIGSADVSFPHTPVNATHNEGSDSTMLAGPPPPPPPPLRTQMYTSPRIYHSCPASVHTSPIQGTASLSCSGGNADAIGNTHGTGCRSLAQPSGPDGLCGAMDVPQTPQQWKAFLARMPRNPSAAQSQQRACTPSDSATAHGGHVSSNGKQSQFLCSSIFSPTIDSVRLNTQAGSYGSHAYKFAPGQTYAQCPSTIAAPAAVPPSQLEESLPAMFGRSTTPLTSSINVAPTLSTTLPGTFTPMPMPLSTPTPTSTFAPDATPRAADQRTNPEIADETYLSSTHATVPSSYAVTPLLSHSREMSIYASADVWDRGEDSWANQKQMAFDAGMLASSLSSLSSDLNSNLNPNSMSDVSYVTEYDRGDGKYPSGSHITQGGDEHIEEHQVHIPSFYQNDPAVTQSQSQGKDLAQPATPVISNGTIDPRWISPFGTTFPTPTVARDSSPTATDVPHMIGVAKLSAGTGDDSQRDAHIQAKAGGMTPSPPLLIQAHEQDQHQDQNQEQRVSITCANGTGSALGPQGNGNTDRSEEINRISSTDNGATTHRARPLAFNFFYPHAPYSKNG